jgi:hypothetical protein
LSLPILAHFSFLYAFENEIETRRQSTKNYYNKRVLIRAAIVLHCS